MRQFLTEVLVFSVILSGCLVLIKQSVPFYWANELMETKIRHILSEDEEYDSFFIGSSKTYRHIVPEIFDETTGSRSYNLGCNGMFFLETHYILENFLGIYPTTDTTHYYLQEKTPEEIASRNLHSVRSKYYMDLKRLRIGLAYFRERGNYAQVYSHLISYLENQLCIGQIIPILKYHAFPNPVIDSEIALADGHYPLDLQLQRTSDQAVKAGLKKRNRGYLRSIKKNRVKEEISIKRLEPKEINVDPGNRPIVFFEISGMPIADNKLFFDRTHLTSEGARLYTRTLASIKESNDGK